jgi:hypothetical protein
VVSLKGLIRLMVKLVSQSALTERLSRQIFDKDNGKRPAVKFFKVPVYINYLSVQNS